MKHLVSLPTLLHAALLMVLVLSLGVAVPALANPPVSLQGALGDGQGKSLLVDTGGLENDIYTSPAACQSETGLKECGQGGPTAIELISLDARPATESWKTAGALTGALILAFLVGLVLLARPR